MTPSMRNEPPVGSVVLDTYWAPPLAYQRTPQGWVCPGSSHPITWEALYSPKYIIETVNEPNEAILAEINSKLDALTAVLAEINSKLNALTAALARLHHKIAQVIDQHDLPER